MKIRFSVLARLFIFGFIGLLIPQVITFAQEPGKDDIKRWNLVKKQNETDTRKMTKMIRVSENYPYISLIRCTVEDIWDPATTLVVTVKPAWSKLPVLQKRKAAVSLLKLWSSLSTLQSPERYPLIKIRDYKGRASNPFLGYKNTSIDDTIDQTTVIQYENRVALPNVYGKP